MKPEALAERNFGSEERRLMAWSDAKFDSSLLHWFSR